MDQVNAEASGSGSPAAQESTANVRAKRSRKDRPCDPCRKQKHICVILVRGEPCEECKKKNRICSFDLPPTKRKRPPKPETGNGDGASKRVATSYAGTNGSIQPVGRRGQSLSEHLRRIRAERAARETEDSDETDDGGIFPVSLDMGSSQQEEHHYVGFASYADLSLEDTKSTSTSISTGKVSFRQVSRDPRRPAFFVKNPSLIYGTFEQEGVGGRSRLNSALEILSSANTPSGITQIVWPDALLEIFISKVLPALPILNKVRLISSLSADMDQVIPATGAGPYPHLLLTGILAHTSFYAPQLRTKIKPLWKVALSALEEDYRQPKLQTLAFAILDLYANPADNHGQNAIALGKAICTAQLLGLHMDSSTWLLPRWEKSVRKRIWWSILIHDKLSSLVFGRPSNLHPSNHNVPVPTSSESDWGSHTESKEDIDAWQAFVGNCKLTLILDKILSRFYTVEAMFSNGSEDLSSGEARMTILQDVSDDLDIFEIWAASNEIGIETELAAEGNPATGVRSMQLLYLGLNLVVARLTFEGGDSSESFLEIALSVAQRMIDFVEMLVPADLESFWSPFSSYHFITCACLLVQAAVKSKGTLILSRCEMLLSKLLAGLLRFQTEHGWVIASTTLAQVSSLLGSIPKEQFPEIAALKEIFFPAEVESDQSEPAVLSETTPTNIELQIDPSSWFNFGFPWAEDWLLNLDDTMETYSA